VERPGWKVLIFPLIPLGTGPANTVGRRYVFPGSYTVRPATFSEEISRLLDVSSYWPKPRLQADRLKEASLVNEAETHAAEFRNNRLDNPFLNSRYRIARLTKLGALDKSFA